MSQKCLVCGQDVNVPNGYEILNCFVDNHHFRKIPVSSAYNEKVK